MDNAFFRKSDPVIAAKKAHSHAAYATATTLEKVAVVANAIYLTEYRVLRWKGNAEKLQTGLYVLDMAIALAELAFASHPI